MSKQENTSSRLKEAMKLFHLTQADIARKSGISKSSISRYVSGEVLPNQFKLYLLGKALHVSPVWLMGLDVPMEWEEATSEDNEQKEVKK